MDAAGYGYYRVWMERAYLLKLAVIPLLVKFACTVAVMALDIDENFLRQGLVMMPAMFAEGWVLAQFLRTLLMNERWPISLPDKPDIRLIAPLILRARGIIASILVYVLLGMLAYVMRHALFTLLPVDGADGGAALDGTDADTSGPDMPEDMDTMDTMDAASAADATSSAIADLFGVLAIIPSLLGIAFSIWFFRFMWLYIPFAVLLPVREYLRALRGFMPSVYLLLLFFSTMGPTTLLAIILMRVIYGATSDIGESGEMLGHFLSVMVSVAAELAVSLVSTASFAWAMRSFLPHVRTAFQDFPGHKESE